MFSLIYTQYKLEYIGPIQIQAMYMFIKYVQNMHPKVGLAEETKGRGKEGKQDSE
jgi:hypothetical protein